MTVNNRRNQRTLFYVVRFLELPNKATNRYVCLPNNWLILRRRGDQKVLIAYPKNEDPDVTKERARRSEPYHKEHWNFYLAVFKYESDTYEDGVNWISSRTN